MSFLDDLKQVLSYHHRGHFNQPLGRTKLTYRCGRPPIYSPPRPQTDSGENVLYIYNRYIFR